MTQRKCSGFTVHVQQDRGGPSTAPAPQPRTDGGREMELVAFRVAFPGVVSVAKVED